MQNKNSDQTKSKDQENRLFRKQVVGGFSKAEVIDYIDKLVSSMEAEKKELDTEKKSVYELMKQGQTFSDNLIAQSTAQAEAILSEAQKEADTILKEAREEGEALHQAHTQFLKQCRNDTAILFRMMSQKHEEIDTSFEQMLSALGAILHGLEGDQDES